MALIRQVSERGEIIAAGAFEEDGDLRGMRIFSTASTERARGPYANDPAFVAGRIVLEFHNWFAPAGVRVVPNAKDAARAP